MAWTRIAQATTRVPALLTLGRYDFDFDGIPLHARNLTWRRRINMLKIGLGEALGMDQAPGMPPVLQIEPTNLCGLNCPLCPTGSGSCERPGGIMSMDTFHQVMDEVGDFLVFTVLFNWGEPFLHPELPAMIRECTNRRILTMTSTNGQHLQTIEEARAVVDAGLSGLVISMDGVTQETFERYRIGGDVEKVRQCVRMVEQAKKEAGSDSPYTSLRVVVTQQNQHELPQIREFAQEAGVDMFSTKSVGCMCESDRYEEYENQDPNLTRFQYVDGERVPTEPVKCHYIFRQPTVYWDGTVVGCEYDYEFEAPLGRIGEQSFEEIWNGAAARHLRRAIRGKTPRPEFCRRCPYEGRTTDTCVLETEELK